MSALFDETTVATYDFAEAAHYLRLPNSTVRAWVCGQEDFRHLITPASNQSPMLSFQNLVELHMLASIRRVHRIKMQKVRAALDNLDDATHPLANQSFLTDGVDLFVDRLGEIDNMSAPDRRAMSGLIHAYLKRIEWQAGRAMVLFPFPTSDYKDQRKSVMIDPRVSFGRLVLVGTGIVADIIIERFRAGESIAELADDYRRDRLIIEDALRFEPPRAA